jgi:hypothetical protein
VDLTNRPDLWAVGVEYDFGNGLYGARFTGTTPTYAAGSRTTIQLGAALGIPATTKVVATGGYWTYGTDGTLIVGQTIIDDGLGIAYSTGVGKQNGQNSFYAIFGGKNVAVGTYDIWVKYTK